MMGHLSKQVSTAAAVAVAGSLMAPGVSSAQTYGYDYPPAYQNSYSTQGYYDPCVGDQRNRATTGGVLGATIGAIAGSQMAARGRRTEGSVLGGVLGAAIGASVGNSSANCDGRYRNSSYDDRYYDRSHAPTYGYDDRGYDDRYGYDYDRRYVQPAPDYRYPAENNCRLAESTVHLPDGRTDTRYVRACMDSSGRYRVVD